MSAGDVTPPAQPDDVGEVQQEAMPFSAAVLVKHDGPIQSQTLPFRAGNAVSVVCTATETLMVDGDDPRRARLVLLPTSGSIKVAFDRAAFRGTPFVLSQGVSLEIRAVDAVFIRATTDTSTVSVLSERWAD